MALNPDNTWTTEANKVNSRPVYLANLEYDYLRAGVTYQADFKATGYAGDADLNTKPGKVILKQTSTDIMTDSSYGSTTQTLYGRDLGSYYIYGFLIDVKKDVYINSFRFNCKSNSGSTIKVYTEVRKCEHSLSKNNIAYSFDIDSGSTARTIDVTTSYADYTFTADSLYPKGSYVLMLAIAYPTSADILQFKTWYPNTSILNSNETIKGWDSQVMSIADFQCTYSGDHVQFYLGNETQFNFTGGVNGSGGMTSFNGYTAIQNVNVQAYTDSTYTTHWMRVKDTSGTGATPSTPGQLRLDYVKPLNTNITFALYGDADGSDAGQVTIDSTAFDGDTISSYYDYYKIVCTMTTTDWFSTPEISSLSAYFKLTNDYCKFDDAFTMADGSPARPYIDAIPSYETRVDPINNKVSFNEPTIDLIIQKKGLSKTQSDIEALIETYFMTGKELAIKVGYNGVASTYFLAYQTGLTNNQVWVNDNIYRLECKDPYFQTKDPFLIDQADTFQPYFSYDNPIDIMLTLISLSGIPQRLIDTSSFSSIKSTYFTSWEFYRPYTEPIKDIKKELDEISLLTGCVAVTKEDGKIYCVKLDNAAGTVVKKSADSQTFNDQNSKAAGKANIDLSKRVNVCSVQRGYWIEPSDTESKDIEYWETEIDEESILDVGRSEVLKIENKWVPRESAIAGVKLASIIAQRIVARFRYGLWTLKRQTDLSFAFIQVGDQVTILGSQILYKNFYGEKSYRGVVIGKEVRPSAGEYEGEIEFTIWIYQNISSTLEPEPTAQGTSLVFSAVDNDEITLDWTDASPACTGYVALFKTGSYPNTLPEDGVQYTAADVVNDATVAYRNTTSGFTHSSLSDDTEYFYKIFSYNDSGTAVSTNYNKITPLVGSRYTMATEPGAQPTTIVFGTFSTDSNTTLTWTDSVTAPLAQAHLVLRSTAATPDTAPTDGVGYDVGDTLGNATVVYNGTAAGSTGFTDTGIAFTGITYYYAIYPFRGSDATSYNYRTSATVLAGSKASTVAEPTAQPTGLSGESITTTEMALAWSAASPAVTGYVVGYKKAASSTGVPVDNTDYTVGGAGFGDMSIGYSGTSTSCTVTGLTAGQYYIFKIFSFNGASPNKNYLTVSPPSFYDVVS